METFEPLTAKEVGAILKLSRTKVFELHREGRLLARYKISPNNKGWRWDRQDVEAFLRESTLPAFREEPAPPFDASKIITVQEIMARRQARGGRQ